MIAHLKIQSYHEWLVFKLAPIVGPDVGSSILATLMILAHFKVPTLVDPSLIVIHLILGICNLHVVNLLWSGNIQKCLFLRCIFESFLNHLDFLEFAKDLSNLKRKQACYLQRQIIITLIDLEKYNSIFGC